MVIRYTSTRYNLIFRRLLLAAGLGLVAVLPGCSDTPVTAKGEAAPPGETAPSLQTVPTRETWDVVTIQGTRVGHIHTAIREVTESGRPLVQVDIVSQLTIKRFEQTSEQRIRATSTETPDGKLLRFRTEIHAGSEAQKTTGRVVGDRLELTATTLGKSRTMTVPWSSDGRGFAAVARSLAAKPMRPGEKRTIAELDPSINQAVLQELHAQDYEKTSVADTQLELLRIEAVTRMPDGQTMQSTMWCDRSGDALKTQLDAMQLLTVRSTKEAALKEIEAADMQHDLGIDLAVKLDRPLQRPHNSRRIRYRLTLRDGDPAEEFVVGPSQQIKSTGSETAEITVFAVRPDRGGNPKAPDEKPADDDLQPNNFIQSDHPKIVTMARTAAGDEADRWKIVLKLERYVHEQIEEKNFSQAFATAAEVAEKMEGDCTEHAVLLAALARASKIPARVAIGLVYMEGSQAFGYHMWTEVYVENRWIGVDATLGQGGLGAAHLKVGHSNLEGAAAYTSFLPIIRIIGQLAIEVIQVE